MNGRLTRRGFLGLAAASAWAPFAPALASPLPAGLGRVTLITGIYIYNDVSFQSERVRIARRDELLPIYEEITAAGPAHNPRWYRLDQGFVHSAYIQRVEAMRLNIPPIASLPAAGQLGEISVPFTQSFRRVGRDWEPLYRLYFQSVHWITALGEGPYPGAWAEITDDLLNVRHMIPATHIRPITPEETAPLSPDVPPEEKHIEVILDEQVLHAYEGDRLVFTSKIASGVPSQDPQPGEIPTDTPTGRFYVQTKWPSRHMGDGRVTSDLEAYELPGVPWVCIFHKDGLALHGAFWHDNFGRRMSHGCINLPNQAARWLYRWTTPQAGPGERYVRAMGTRLDIR